VTDGDGHLRHPRHHRVRLADGSVLEPLSLFAYYSLRGLSLLALPLTLADGGSHVLGWFALFYGLDWVATLAPSALANIRRMFVL
jgi:hypothetical protein